MSRAPFNLTLLFVAVVSGIASAVLAFQYGQLSEANATGVPFLLRADTYKIILPFLLTTVTVGLVGLAYTQYQSQRERERERLEKKVEVLSARAAELRSFFSNVLTLFQTAKRARRHVRLFCRRAGQHHEMRYADFLNICEALTTAELMAETIVKRFDVEPNLVCGVIANDFNAEEAVRRRHLLMRGQIDGLRRVLREVARSIEWAEVGSAVSEPNKEWVVLPNVFITYAQRANVGGQHGFHDVAANFDDFTKSLVQVIAMLEAEKRELSTTLASE